jgi:hypothetical protein
VFLFGRRPETRAATLAFSATPTRRRRQRKLTLYIHFATSASGLISSEDRVAEKEHENAALFLNNHKLCSQVISRLGSRSTCFVYTRFWMKTTLLLQQRHSCLINPK